MAKSSPSERRASGRPGSPRARVFLALDLPERERAALADWRDRAIGGRDEVRPVPTESLHATLVFLGYQFERDVSRIAQAAFGPLEGRGPVRLRPLGVVAVPSRGPRLFALDLDDADGDCAALQTAAVEALTATGLHRPERRPFWPHVTLARVKRGRRAAALEAPAPPVESLDAVDVTLYRSLLRPQGAVYEPLERMRLEG